MYQAKDEKHLSTVFNGDSQHERIERITPKCVCYTRTRLLSCGSRPRQPHARLYWMKLWQTVGVSRPSDFDEHVAAAKMFHRAADLVPPVEKALR